MSTLPSRCRASRECTGSRVPVRRHCCAASRGWSAKRKAGLLLVATFGEDTTEGIGLPVHERRVGYVFQEPRLFAHLTVEGNLRFGERRSRAPVDAEYRQRIVQLLGLEDLLPRSPRALSGGEAQRVAIGRALLRAPRVLLMDEPLAALDRKRKEDVLPFLDRLHAELALPIIYVSHDLDEMCRLCDHLLVLDEGRVTGIGGVSSVLASTDPPVVPSVEVSAMIETEVAGHDASDDITTLKFSGGEFLMAGRVGERGRRLRLRIKGERRQSVP